MLSIEDQLLYNHRVYWKDTMITRPEGNRNQSIHTRTHTRCSPSTWKMDMVFVLDGDKAALWPGEAEGSEAQEPHGRVM